MKILVSLVFLLSSTLSVAAEGWDLPEEYNASESALVEDAGALCNQGDESFASFIQKWNSSGDFRMQRTLITDVTRSQCPFLAEDDTLQMFVSMLPNYEGVLPLKAAKRSRSNWSTWFNVTADTAGYYTVGAFLMFVRVDGKWYCTVCGLAG